MEIKQEFTVSDGGSGRGLAALAAACLLGLSVGAGGTLLLAGCPSQGTYAVPAGSEGDVTMVNCIDGAPGPCASSYTTNTVAFNACGGYSEGTYCDKIGTVPGIYWQGGSCGTDGCYPPPFVTPVKIGNYVAENCPGG